MTTTVTTTTTTATTTTTTVTVTTTTPGNYLSVVHPRKQILYHMNISLAFNINLLTNGDAESGACQTGSDRASPTG